VVVGDPNDSLTVIDMLAQRIEICQYVFVDAPDVTTEPELCCAPLLQFALDEEQASELAEVLKALADPVRLRLVSIIGTAEAGEVCACDLPTLVERSQPTVSHHLSMLVKAGVLEREQRGKWAWFRVRPERLAELGDALVNTR
jgi:ArsR family transcriptional regulator